MKTKISDIVILTHYICLYPTFKEWKPINYSKFKIYLLVYILPLRNENASPVSQAVAMVRLGLYPTFKEWKRRNWYVFPNIPPGLYPTFKEWKRKSVF